MTFTAAFHGGAMGGQPGCSQFKRDLSLILAETLYFEDPGGGSPYLIGRSRSVLLKSHLLLGDRACIRPLIFLELIPLPSFPYPLPSLTSLFWGLFITTVSFDCESRSKGVLHPRREPSPYKEKAKAKGDGFPSIRVCLLLESPIHHGRDG